MPLLEQSMNLDDAFLAVTSELRRAGVDRKHGFRFFTFSTYDGLQVGSRTVVLRAFDQQHRAWIYTDVRSGKIRDLRHRPSATLLFYHPQKRAQIRITATVAVHHLDETAITHWRKVQGEGQKAYLTQLSPGERIASSAEGWQWKPPSESNFAVLVCTPLEIEALQLDGSHHLRALFEKQEGLSWAKTWLVA